MNKMSLFLGKLRHSYYGIIKALGFLLTLAVVVLLMPRNVKFKYEYQKNMPWQHESLYAPFDFGIYKTEDTLRKDREEAKKNFEPVLIYDSQIINEGYKKLHADFNTLCAENFTDNDYCDSLTGLVSRIYEDIEYTGLVKENRITHEFQPNKIVKVRGKEKNDKKCHYERLLTRDRAGKMVQEEIALNDAKAEQMLENFLISHLCENVFYDEKLNENEEKEAIDNVGLFKGMIHEGDLVIAAGGYVNDEKYQILYSLQKAYTDNTDNSFFGKNYLFYGQLLMVALAFIALYLTLKMLRPEIFEHLRYINLILLLMLLMIIPSFLLQKYVPSLLFLMPLAIMAMLLMTFFDARVALTVQVITLIIISLAIPNPFQYFFVQLIVSFVAVFSMTKRASRASYFNTSLLVFLTYVIVYVGITLVFDGDFKSFNWRHVVICGGNAVLTMLTLPLALLFERVFGFVTDLSLLELSNTNSPLLRKLASEAPGTFQHVMQVADLCEEVIYNIGGNTLLVRTGAMYHDIGKIKNPDYFIENQHGKYNPHDDVSNVESAQIIISHVIDGIEICRKYHIPEQIIDFVRTHHGTRRTEYFYQMELRENPDDIDEQEFCYPGPVPFSKETAVLMMCDAVEAATRSMKEKTEESLNKLVENIIDGQVKANQFDNTDITFHDIKITKKVLKKKLMSIYHVRIAYPDN